MNGMAASAHTMTGVPFNWRYQQAAPELSVAPNPLSSSDGRGREFTQAALDDLRGQSWITTFLTEVERIYRLPDNWDSYGSASPNKRARLAAYETLEFLWDAGLEPVRVAPIADEGFIIWISTGGLEASIECLNSGEVSAEIINHGGPKPLVTQDSNVGIREAVEFVVESIPASAVSDVPWLATSGSDFWRE